MRAFRNHVSICGTDDESYAFVFVVVVALHTGKTNDNEMTAFRIVDLCDFVLLSFWYGPHLDSKSIHIISSEIT